MINKSKNIISIIGTFLTITGISYMIIALIGGLAWNIDPFKFNNLYVGLVSILVAVSLGKFYYLPHKR